MNCKKCGAPLVENDKFCKSCGAAANEVSAQNNVGGSQPTFTQNEFGESQQPMNNEMGVQPMNNYQQPMNNGMGVQPMNNYQQPMNNGMGVQPMNNYQQPMNNGMSAQPMNNYQQPKSNNTKFILIGVGVAVVIVAVVVILIFALGGNKSNSGGNDVGATDVGTTDSGSTINKTSTYTVNFKGFTFKIPTDLVYEAQADSILIGDEDGTWASYIEVIEGSYNQLLSKKNQLQVIYQQQGFISSAAVTKTVGGLDFITLEISKGGQNALLGISKANSMNVFGITAITQANEFDYELLETMSGILKTAEFNDTTNNMSVFEKVDMNVISGLAQ